MLKELIENPTPEETALLDEFERVLLAYKDLVLCRECFQALKKEHREGKAAMIVWRAMHNYHERVDELAPLVEQLLWQRRTHTGLALPAHYPQWATKTQP